MQQVSILELFVCLFVFWGFLLPTHGDLLENECNLKLIGTQGSASAQLLAGGEVYPNPFSKIKKCALILETYTLIVLIYGLNF